MSRRPSDLLVGSLLLLSHGCWLGVAQQDSFIEVTSPESGDVFRAGDTVRVEWEAPQDSSFFDVFLLNDGNPVGDAFCDGGCLAPNGFLEATLPTDLEAGSLYTFLVGDRVAAVSMFGESEAFQIMAVAASSATDDPDAGADGGTTDTDADGDDDGDAEGEAVAEDTGDGDGGDGDGDGFRWGVVIGAVAAGLGLAALCVVLVLACCRKGRAKDKSSAKVEGSGSGSGQSGGGDGGGHKGDSGGAPKGPGVSGDVFASSGGQSDGGASVAALAEMGALSPVQEENAEVVTKNPMISAMANGAQFHSSGGSSARFNSNGGSSARFNSNGAGSARFNSSGGSSKFQSVGGGSSNEGDGGSTRGPGDEDEESGGMFADADVVAALAAAAAHGVGKKGGMSIKRSGSGTPRWDGGWIRSPAWNRQKSAAPAVVVAQQSSSPAAAASKAEEKSAEAAGDSEPEAVAPAAAAAAAPADDWMVSTRESFSSRKSAEAAAFMEALRMDSIAAAREQEAERAGGRLASGAPMEEKKAEESEAADAVPAAMPGARTGQQQQQQQQPFSPTSPQSVDGISAKAFGQAEVVASKLPVVRGQGVVSEPECEVPKPALSSGRPGGAARKHGDYSWLLSSSGSMDKARPVSPSGDSPPQASHAKTPRNSNTPPPSVGGGSTPRAAVKSPSVLPADPAHDQSEAAGGSAPKHAGELGQDSAARTDQRDAAGLLPPKSQGVPGRRTLLTPRGGAGKGFSATTPTPSSTAKPSRVTVGTPGRGPRVSQVVEVFEGLTPRGKSGSASGFSTPGRPAAAAAQARAGGPGPATPGASKPARSALAPTSPLTVEGCSSAHAPVTPGTGKGAPTPGALTPGAVGWSTPVATPDRPLGAADADPARDEAQGTAKESAANAAPEELSRGGDSPGGGGGEGRGWSTPLATPDRSPKHSAPDSGRGGATPECTTTEPHASRAGKAGGESPTDEGQFAWQLESPAGVDGLPSPMGSGDVRVLAIGKKRGRIIPAILGASNTPVNDGTPVLTPSTADNKAPSHSVVSSGDSSVGTGSAWEMEPPFGASQVAAFVADAQAEAAAEAHALVVEAQAEAAEEEAAEEKARAEVAKDETARSAASDPAEDGARTSEPALTPAAPAAPAAGAGGAEPPRVTAEAAPKLHAPAPITAPALATIAAKLSPISSARSSALQAPLPTVGAASSPITALAPTPMPTAEVDHSDGKGTSKGLEGRAPTPAAPRTENHEAATAVAAEAAETQASQAATAAMAAATAAAEADAAAEDAAAEAKEAAMEADKAEQEATAAAKAATQREAETSAKAVLVEETRQSVAEQADNVTITAAKESPAATLVATSEAPADVGEADTDADDVAGEGDEDEGMGGVVVYSADAAWREVYNDAEADTSDGDTDGDDIMIDVGEEQDWSTATAAAAAASALPAAHGVAAISNGATEVPAGGTWTGTGAGPAAGENQHAQRRETVEGGAGGRAQEDSDSDSLQGEASGVDALVATAMALAHAAENDADGLYGGAESYEGGGGGEQFHTATTSASDKEYASPRGSVRDVVTSGVFGSAKSAANWNDDGEDTDGGDAEREAEEVQALVAEALALVKEANEDA